MSLSHTKAVELLKKKNAKLHGELRRTLDHLLEARSRCLKGHVEFGLKAGRMFDEISWESQIEAVEKGIQQVVETFLDLQSFAYIPPPDKVSELLREAMSETLSGKQHFLFKPTKRTSGDKSLGSLEHRYIAVAVMYVDCARRGVIDDSSFIKTIQQAYGVSARTVRGWQSDQRFAPHPQNLKQYSGMLDVLAASKRAITELMKVSGMMYRRLHGKFGDPADLTTPIS